MEEKIINETEILDNSEGILNEEYETEPQQNRFEISVRDNVFAILFSLASIIMSAFGLWGGFRAGFSVSAILMILVATAYFLQKGVRVRAFPLVCAISAVGTAVSFAVTSNPTVRFMSFFVAVILSLVWFMSLVDERSEKGDLGIFTTIFLPIFELAIPHIPITVYSLFSSGGERRKLLAKALLGIVLALPVLLVVVPLLMSSDAAFSGLAEKLFSNLALTAVKVAVGLVIALFVISYCFSLKKKELPEIRESNFKGVDSTVIASFLAVLSVCYLTYLFSQLAYFFSAFSGFLPDDYSFTPAQYARRGFFEMSIIAAINLVIIFATLLISRKTEGKISIFARILCTFIGVFTLIIISTAISKMVLYIDRFGMTVLRLTTSAFMVFLAVVFISLMLRLFIPKVRVLRTALVTAAAVLTILGIVNVNHVVAAYNYNAYEKEILDEIDTYTLYKLGDEGVPYLVKLAEDDNYNTSQMVRERLLDCIRYGEYYEVDEEYSKDLVEYKIIDKKYDGLGEYSFSRGAAYKALDSFLAQNPDFLTVYNESSEYYY